MASVAVFGGSFNPPHVAHVLACVLARKTGGVDRVLVVPTYRHAFAKALAPYERRLAMCELAMGDLPGVEISRAEEELGGESRTLRLLEHLARARPHDTFRLLVGAGLLIKTFQNVRGQYASLQAEKALFGNFRLGRLNQSSP